MHKLEYGDIKKLKILLDIVEEFGIDLLEMGESLEKKEFEIGEKVVIKSTSGSAALLGFEVGEVVTISEYSTIGANDFEVRSQDKLGFASAEHLRKLTPFEPEEEEEEENAEEGFVKGDFVRALNEGEFGGIMEGGIGIYISDGNGLNDSDEYSVEVKSVKGVTVDFFKRSDLIKITDTREISFYKNGRRVNEIKTGDIVSTKYYGLLEVINVREGVRHSLTVIIEGEEDFLMPEACSLVATKENRTDESFRLL